MIKNYIENANFEDTGFAYTLPLISGKHKMVILYCLMEFETVRFNELKRYLKTISDKTLSTNLKELEKSCNELSDMVYDLCDVIKKLENDLDEANGMIDDLLGDENISSNEENLELESFEDILEAASEAKNKIPKKLKSVEIDFDPFKKKLGLYFHMGSKN